MALRGWGGHREGGVGARVQDRPGLVRVAAAAVGGLHGDANERVLRQQGNVNAPGRSCRAEDAAGVPCS